MEKCIVCREVKDVASRTMNGHALCMECIDLIEGKITEAGEANENK